MGAADMQWQLNVPCMRSMRQTSAAACLQMGWNCPTPYQEAGSEGARQRAPPSIRAARRVLCGEQHEVRVRAHRLPQLGDVQLPIIIQQPEQQSSRSDMLSILHDVNARPHKACPLKPLLGNVNP
jgi:hypothetical protein